MGYPQGNDDPVLSTDWSDQRNTTDRSTHCVDVSEIRLTRDLMTIGSTYNTLAKRRRTGDLHHLRRGAYVVPHDRTPEELHRLMIESTMALGIGDSVISFASAAVMHGLPVPWAAIKKVHLTRNRAASGRIGSVVHLHVAPLRAEDVCLVHGLPVTSLARTFVDLARTVPLGWGVATGDQALRAGMSPDEVSDQLDLARRRHGSSRARAASRLLDPLSESPGESLSRVAFFEEGLPAPELQVDLYDGPTKIATVDFLWREQGTVGEFDGEVKYGRLVRRGEAPADVVFREKRREDAIRGLGLQMARWVWAEVFERTVLLERVLRTFRRGKPFRP